MDAESPDAPPNVRRLDDMLSACDAHLTEAEKLAATLLKSDFPGATRALEEARG